MTRYRRRRIGNQVAVAFALGCTAFGLGWLVWLLGTLVVSGVGALELAVFARATPPPGQPGGLGNAILGSVILTALGVAIGAPLGVLAGTYLAEFGRGTRLASVIRFLNDILLSAPSIIIGVFVYTGVVRRMGTFSGWAGALALALIVLPIVVRTTENMLRLVPDHLREAAVALGASRARVVTTVLYRASLPGILTGILLAVARISGETAPLLFTALHNQFWSVDLGGPFPNLPVVIFQFALSPFPDWQRLAWAGAFLITASVLALNVLARIASRPRKES